MTFLIYENTLHTNLLHKFGAEQIYGKPKRKDKISTNVKAFRFVLNGVFIYWIQKIMWRKFIYKSKQKFLRVKYSKNVYLS